MEKGGVSDWGVFRAERHEVAERGLASAVRIILLGLIVVVPLVMGTRARSRDDSGFERFRVIAERSMFARPGTGATETAAASSDVAPGAVPTGIRLVGIVRTSDPLSSIAIIEAGGRHRLCHVGDQIGTLVLRSIRDHDIVFESPEGHWLAEIEPGTIPQRGVVPQTRPPAGGFVQATDEPVPGAQRRLPVRAVDIRKLARAGLVAHTEDGVVTGLRLTRDALGLKEGDRVTSVDGQALCTAKPKQKLWQIVRKHSASKDRPAEIHVVVERNDQTLEFLVAPIG